MISYWKLYLFIFKSLELVVLILAVYNEVHMEIEVTTKLRSWCSHGAQWHLVLMKRLINAHFSIKTRVILLFAFRLLVCLLFISIFEYKSQIRTYRKSAVAHRTDKATQIPSGLMNIFFLLCQKHLNSPIRVVSTPPAVSSLAHHPKITFKKIKQLRGSAHYNLHIAFTLTFQACRALKTLNVRPQPYTQVAAIISVYAIRTLKGRGCPCPYHHSTTVTTVIKSFPSILNQISVSVILSDLAEDFIP